MKSLRILVLAALTLALVPAALAADFGIRAGRYNDGDQDFVGAELLFDVGTFNVNPNIEYLLEDDVTAGSANLDITVDIISIATVSPYVGAGVGLSYVDLDTGGSHSDVVGNLIGGLTFHLGGLRPYAQVKYVRVLQEDEAEEDDSDIALTIGLRF